MATYLLRRKMEYLKVKGVPVIVRTEAERADAFNVARDLGIEITTRKRNPKLGQTGFEIYRTK